MVSTRQMCGAGSAEFASSSSAATNADACNTHLVVSQVSQMPVTRTSVVRRTTQQSQQTLIKSSNNCRIDILHNGPIAPDAVPSMNLLDLPQELLFKIFSFLDYRKISNLRMVSNGMNELCMSILNSAFLSLIHTTFQRFHAIKANMPRRESARRNHPLACQCDIIETCHMRLSLLQMTMGKHIERGHCCFFPGAILDEVFSILKFISITPPLQRPYRVTDELFDLSTMAMEYFKDRIEPTLPSLAFFKKDYFKVRTTIKRPTLDITSSLTESVSSTPPQNHMVLRKGIRKIKQGMKIYNNQLTVLRTELRTCKRKAAEQSKILAEQQNLLAEHQKQTLEYANRLDENDKKNEEISRKFSTLLQELNKCKTELQFWRSKSPAIPSVCSACNQKVAPVLPPEDFQALVNQGIDPDHIIINDDTDAESDTSASELQLTLENEFVFPDETTTAKLMAVNTATKNLKRKSQPDAENVAAMPSTSKAAALETVTGEVQSSSGISGGGYSTKLFYGNFHRENVIVSPGSMKLPTVTVHHQTAGEADNEDAKKGRRVQKATRCVNMHSKRSK